MLGYAYAYEGDLQRALAAVDRYAALLPPNDPNPIETAAAYRKNMELHPTWLSGVSGIKLARMYLYQGKYSLAEASAHTAYDKSVTTGKLLEQNGKKAEAINACQEFLGHFESSTAKLLQIAEARAALKRLL